jgi:hypothetical protein
VACRQSDLEADITMRRDDDHNNGAMGGDRMPRSSAHPAHQWGVPSQTARGSKSVEGGCRFKRPKPQACISILRRPIPPRTGESA